VFPALAAPVPGGTLDPLIIPKYVTPLVIPPEMPKSTASPAPAADYDIAVRQFKQQILPGGLWDQLTGRADGLPATTVWSYGRAQDPVPDIRGVFPALTAGIAPAPNSSFNYPAFTIEATSMAPTNVRWINDLVNPATGNFLPHLLNVDQTLVWANPPMANCVTGIPNRTDCETAIATPYVGPIPLVTHLHGAHIQPHSDGYPEAWWLPGAPGTKGIPASYAERGTHFTQGNTANAVPGSAYYSYENTQPATTLWYHDHALGMTRLNVYAGTAGFWLIRGGVNDTLAGVLPGPAPSITGGDPNFSPAVRNTIREIPLAIQDRSFNVDGSLFYPADRSFFDGFTGPFIGSGVSDISGIWNPEAFFNTMVVNGTTWPKFEVAPARYRLRLLNGCNSRTLNLALFTVTSIGADNTPGTADDVLGTEIPFYQIGAEQGFLPQVAMITTGFSTPLPGNGTIPAPIAAPDPQQALLMGSAERADVIVDFSGIANGTRIRMINTAPDAPFGGFPDVPADTLTTGQVMDFIVNTALPAQPTDTSSVAPQNLVLPAEPPLGAENFTRQVSLNEMMSDQVCVEIDPIAGSIVLTLFSTVAGDPNFLANCAAAAVTPGNVAEPMGPRMAQLGTVENIGGNLVAFPKLWGDPITEIPRLNDIEIWEIFNTTVDAHPIHLHLVGFEVVNRQDLDPTALLAGNLVPIGTPVAPNPNEAGFKDTVLAFPGQVTRIKAKFDIAGLYVWHCHIVEHEDNEMMRPMIVAGPVTVSQSPSVTSPQVIGTSISFVATGSGGVGQLQYQFWLKDTSGVYTLVQPFSTTNTWNWTTTGLPAGGYSIAVQAKETGSTAPNGFDAENVTNFVLLPSPATTIGVVTTPGTPTVSFTATATGGSGPYEYQFWLKDLTGAYSLAQPYSASNVFNWDTTGLPAGSYNIAVQAKSAGSVSMNGYDVETVVSYALASGVVPASTLGIVTTPNLPQVTFTATAGGGSGTYEYQFWLKDLSGAYTLVQPYSASNVFNWNTTGLPAGTYYIATQAKSSGSISLNGFDVESVVNFAIP
jgi:FtsP/CotA-like multicopper oxidase with cupredoxin domain